MTSEILPLASPVVASLRTFSRWENEAWTEEQRFVETDAGVMFTTVFLPRGAVKPVGFLACHSFAWEQAELSPLELLFARAAASAGFPVLSFHALGYGDSHGDFAGVTMTSHLRDAGAAAAALSETAGVDDVIPVGARWGASVAAATAASIGAPGMVLWNPSLRPGRYLDGLLKVLSMAGMMDSGSAGAVGALKASLAAGETIDLLGYPLTAACYSEARAFEPLRAVRAGTRALLVQINPIARREIVTAQTALDVAGVDVHTEEAEGEGRAAFGLGMPLSGHLATHKALFDDVVARTMAWVKQGW